MKKSKAMAGVLLILVCGLAFGSESIPLGYFKSKNGLYLNGSPQKIIEKFASINDSGIVQAYEFYPDGIMKSYKNFRKSGASSMSFGFIEPGATKEKKGRLIESSIFYNGEESNYGAAIVKVLDYDEKGRASALLLTSSGTSGLITKIGPSYLIKVSYSDSFQLQRKFSHSENGFTLVEIRRYEFSPDGYLDRWCYGEIENEALPCNKDVVGEGSNVYGPNGPLYSRTSTSESEYEYKDGFLSSFESRRLPGGEIEYKEEYSGYVKDGCGNWTRRIVSKIESNADTDSHEESREITYYKSCLEDVTANHSLEGRRP